jgi:hypothetical protein
VFASHTNLPLSSSRDHTRSLRFVRYRQSERPQRRTPFSVESTFASIWLLVPIAATDSRVWTVCWTSGGVRTSKDTQAQRRPVIYVMLIVRVRTSAVIGRHGVVDGRRRGSIVWYSLEQEQRGRHPGRRRWWRSFWLVMVGAACHLISCPSRTWASRWSNRSSSPSGSLGEYFFHLSGRVLHGAY